MSTNVFPGCKSHVWPCLRFRLREGRYAERGAPGVRHGHQRSPPRARVPPSKESDPTLTQRPETPTRGPPSGSRSPQRWNQSFPYLRQR